MDGTDERLDPLRSFAVHSLRLDPERWRELVSEDEVTFNSFFNTQDYMNLFICQDSETGLSASLDFPKRVRTKVICVSKTSCQVLTKENVRKSLIIQEVHGEDAMSVITAVSKEVTCLLLSNPDSSSSWAAGVAEEALSFAERQKNEALATRAQVEGRTFLPHPDSLHEDRLHSNAVSNSTPRDDDDEGRTQSDVKLLHACDWTIIEWAELVSQLLQQDSSQPLVDGLKPLPSEEFHFWRSRLDNLRFIQQQLRSSRAQQVASILQQAESVYLSTLSDIHRDVQEGLREAEDVTLNLRAVQEKLEEVEQMEYQQLRHNMAAVMEELRLLWIRSEFYCKPGRLVVLLQEVCNLLVQQSRRFLRGPEVLCALVSGSGSGPVLQEVSLVVWTLQTFRRAYRETSSQLEEQDGDTLSCWDFPSHLVFFHLDNFLLHLHKIQEAFRVSLQLRQLEHTVLGGAGGRMWTDQVQQVYQDFLGHVTVLSDCSRDPTDPDDQSFQLHLDQFQVQVLDLERRLVSVLSRALEVCSVSSAAKLVKMFDFILDRPLIQDQLRPHLSRLLQMVLVELDQTELLFCAQRQKCDTFSRFSPTAAAGLCWTRQLRLRAEVSLDHYETVRLHLDPGGAQLVPHRFQQVLDVLQDFSDAVRTDWSSQLDSDCGLILDQPLIHKQQGMLGVSCSHKLEVVLRELRCVSRWAGVELRPSAARLFTCRDDITQSYLSLSHMVSCYNQVVSDILQVELPLIQDQLHHLNHTLAELQGNTWSCEGVQQLVQQHRDRVSILHCTVSEARANMDAMTHIIQGWAELHLLQRSGDSLLEAGATEQNYRHIREEGQELLRLTQVNRSLYGAEASSESWSRYLDHIDDKVQDGLFQLLLSSLHYLSDNMNPQSGGGGVFVAVRLQLQETGSVFEPSVGGGLSDLLKTVYTAANQLPRISVRRHGNYQVSLQQNPVLSAVEQEVMRRLLQVREEAERLRAGLDRYAYLWQSDRTAVMQEFLTYSRQLGAEQLEAEEATPTLKDFQTEMESLQRLSAEVTHLDDVIVLHSWLQVDLGPFRDSLLSIIQDRRHLYTQYLLDSVRDSLQQVTQRGDDSSSSFPLTETIDLLEAAGVQLPNM